MSKLPPIVGRLRGVLYVLALLGGASLGYFEGAVWPIERLYGGWVNSGTAGWGMEDWAYDHRDGSVSGVVVHTDGVRIGSVEDARVSLILMDEVTYDFEHVGVRPEAEIVADGRRAEWHVHRFVVPSGKRFRGVALDGSFRDGDGHDVKLGGQMAAGGPSFAESARIRNQCDGLVARGEAAVSDAIALLASDDPFDRSAAASALCRIGKRPDLAVPALLSRLGVERYTLVKDDIIYALGDLGADAAAAVPSIRDVAVSPSTRDQNRRAAFISLGRIGPSAAQAVPDLVHALSAEGVLYRLLAASSLGQIGPAAREARPALEGLAASTGDWNTQTAVRDALARIGD